MSDAPDSKLAWIDAYLAHLRGVRQLSPHTTAAYARDLQALAALSGALDWSKLGQHAIRRLTAKLHAQQLDPRSIARKLSSWRGFFNWLGEQTPLAANPVQGVVVQDRQWIATPGGGIAYHLTHQIPAGLVVSKSIDGGLTYPQHTVAATPADQTGCVCPPGTLIAEGGSILGGGKVGFVYSTSTGGVNFAYSTNGGLTFTNVPVRVSDSNQDTGRAFPVIANAGGNPAQSGFGFTDTLTTGLTIHGTPTLETNCPAGASRPGKAL